MSNRDEALKYAHVKADIRHLVDLPAEQRIQICRHDIWIDTPRLKPLLNCLNHMVYTDNQIQASSIFIHGGGGDGKSALFHRLQALGELSGKKMVFITLTENLNRYKLHDAICEQFSVQIGKRTTAANRLDIIEKKIHSGGIGAIVIDELSDAMLEGSTNKRIILSLLRSLAEGKLKLCVIAFGNSVANEAMILDRVLDRRFVQWELQPWKLDQHFVDFIATYETHLPLKLASNVASPKLRTLIHSNSHGILDNIVKILKSAAMDAIEQGTERITQDQIPNIDALAMKYGFKIHHPGKPKKK
ncbi:TniB family NTP-binding protein [Stutzerimonas sp. VN223-3]|uniref:TniB family NTP-binding protein n=1 Tax=Stutzerimonas sp. VN223-3 TaxID=3384601 RepID=UPI0038B5C487